MPSLIRQGSASHGGATYFSVNPLLVAGTLGGVTSPSNSDTTRSASARGGDMVTVRIHTVSVLEPPCDATDLLTPTPTDVSEKESGDTSDTGEVNVAVKVWASPATRVPDGPSEDDSVGTGGS